MTIFASIGILHVKWMSAFAMSLARLLCHWATPPQDVLALCHRLQMIGADTRTHPA
jgi:hypothetical protein